MLDISNIHAASTERLEAIKARHQPQPKIPSPDSSRQETSHLETLQNYLNKFIAYRHSYSNDLPKHILQPGDPNYERYKCRTTWWTIISGNIQLARDAELFQDANAQNKVREFFDYIKTVQTKRTAQINKGLEYRYTLEDIAGADAFLDQFIAYFSQRAMEAGAETPPPAIA